MKDAVDYYDVERMIQDAVRPLQRELAELREQLGTERVERQDADESLRAQIPLAVVPFGGRFAGT